ncbi:cytochrome b/b6 domain-containing protein [Croceicoccus mobilis]|uniref:Nickel-dependent hydrogenase b-type cytochrome subunit n=1 Tax=Croceicoccus mobilis TaxID=1703339 RepID=A0A917DV52_9SPHN|nr:cytochrome b/b6 domain-containing protein [Croceicoccus mobilis]GGD70456.1 nickel-dependent hydrogenase b-type cytochrome subunit [Croceicoccus mobilis]
MTGIAARVAIWDLPIRLFHWLLVGLMAFSWWSGEEHELELHRTSGYFILALIVFRIFWGFAGTRTARFSTFVKGPASVAAYTRSLASRSGKPAGGHNPLGGWSVIAMLLAIGLMVAAGLFAVDVDGWESGPLADYISFDQGRAAADIHEVLFKIILALVALHVAAIAFYRIWKRQNLIGPMILGKGKSDIANSRVVIWKLLIGMLIAAATAYAVSTGFRF